MDQSQEQPNKFTRRRFIQGALALGAALGLGAKLRDETSAQQEVPNSTPLPQQSESSVATPTPEVITEQSINLYNDLTPGIGIGVAWVGSGSIWNPIVENIIKATTGVNLAPFIFVPQHQEGNFDAYISENNILEGSYHKIICDPSYEENSDAIDPRTGENKKTIKSGFPSSWIRDFGTLVGTDGSEKLNLNIKKNWMPDPLNGTNVELAKKDFGLKFDGGAFFYLKKKDGTPYVLASENEFVNNNSYYIKKEKGEGINVKEEVSTRIKDITGENTEIVYLPKLVDSGVDHIDTFIMPVGDDTMIVGESLEDDLNFELLNNVAKLFAEKGFRVHRVPIRRFEENHTVTYTNVLPHITSKGEKYIFMPTYEGFEAENDIAKTIYSNLGFTVVPVDASSTKDYGGSIHCATNTSVTAPFISNI